MLELLRQTQGFNPTCRLPAHDPALAESRHWLGVTGRQGRRG